MVSVAAVFIRVSLIGWEGGSVTHRENDDARMLQCSM
jgi:hypothetical protein